MENSDFNGGALAMFVWILTLALSIGSGILSWNWIEPHSFFGAIGFLILWGILSKVGHMIAFGVLYAMFEK
ncbi:MAG: hypothetical protein WCL21_18845 [Mariniphaga sp.]